MPKGIKGFQKGHGSFWTEKSKEKMRSHIPFQLGRKRSPETIKKLSESHKGQHSSPQTEFKKKDNTAIIMLGKNEYRNLHKWVNKQLGRPSKCEECGFIGYGKRMHWANKSKKYMRDMSDWIRLCVRCHYYFDKFNQ